MNVVHEMGLEGRMEGLVGLLCSPLVASLLRIHPNDVGTSLAVHLVSEGASERNVPEEWRTWWLWAGKHPHAWENLILFNDLKETASKQDLVIPDSDIPSGLRKLILQINELALPRYASLVSLTFESLLPDSKQLMTPGSFTSKGMSPKKVHEVNRMMVYILYLLDQLCRHTGMKVKHIVDIGAGQVRADESICMWTSIFLHFAQGYLSHALCAYSNNELKMTPIHYP